LTKSESQQSFITTQATEYAQRTYHQGMSATNYDVLLQSIADSSNNTLLQQKVVCLTVKTIWSGHTMAFTGREKLVRERRVV